MEKFVYHNGKPFGTVMVEKEGNYLCFNGECPFIPGIFRLHLYRADGTTLPLGVCMPENGRMTVHRKILISPKQEEAMSAFQYGVLAKGDEAPVGLRQDDAPTVQSSQEDYVEVVPQVYEAAEEEAFAVEEVYGADAPLEEDLADMGLQYPDLDRWLETTQPESFTEDIVLQATLSGAQGVLYRYRLGYIELALPASCHEHIAPVLLFARTERIRGEEYFILKLDGEGFPQPADAPSTY